MLMLHEILVRRHGQLAIYQEWRAAHAFEGASKTVRLSASLACTCLSPTAESFTMRRIFLNQTSCMGSEISLCVEDT